MTIDAHKIGAKSFVVAVEKFSVSFLCSSHSLLFRFRLWLQSMGNHNSEMLSVFFLLLIFLNNDKFSAFMCSIVSGWFEASWILLLMQASTMNSYWEMQEHYMDHLTFVPVIVNVCFWFETATQSNRESETGLEGKWKRERERAQKPSTVIQAMILNFPLAFMHSTTHTKFIIIHMKCSLRFSWHLHNFRIMKSSRKWKYEYHILTLSLSIVWCQQRVFGDVGQCHFWFSCFTFPTLCCCNAYRMYGERLHFGSVHIAIWYASVL